MSSRSGAEGGHLGAAGGVGGRGTILGIETSCDETAAAVVVEARDIRSSVVSSQVDLHARFGGVVPEIASRAHVELLTPVIAEALVEAGCEDRDIDAVAATYGPGLVGALLVGVSTAKALALVWDVPFVAVNHLEAHLYASFLEDPDIDLPVVVLLVSGGHTLLVAMEGRGRYRLLGSTLDDAAGEAFDKVARYLGLGYPGGPAIDRLANEGDPEAIAFPRAMLDEGFDFSFSGLKTSVINHVRKHPDVGDGRRGRVVPGGGGRRPGGQGPAGREGDRGQGPLPRRRRGRQLAAAGAVPRRLRGGRAAGLRAEPGDVHRQRRHGGGRRLVEAPSRGPEPHGHRRRRRPDPAVLT